jgi:hypothetical protein
MLRLRVLLILAALGGVLLTTGCETTAPTKVRPMRYSEP